MRKLLLLPVLVLALTAASPAGADDRTANISAAGFPALLAIQNGDRVVWRNQDTKAHQIVADDDSFKSEVLQPGQRFAHIFVTPGTYTYHDGAQPTFKGTVQVSETRTVTIQSAARSIAFNRVTTLSGKIAATSSEKVNNQRVTVMAMPAGSSTFSPVGRTTTNANGLWELLVRPQRNTVYQAVWKNVPSSRQSVLVKPLLTLKQTGRKLFALGVHADANLRFHRALIQRWVAKRHVWKTLRVVRLTGIRATSSEITVTAVFRMKAAHGTILRGLMTAAQAAPAQFGPAASRPIRV
jgi:plastocyanin